MSLTERLLQPLKQVDQAIQRRSLSNAQQALRQRTVRQEVLLATEIDALRDHSQSSPTSSGPYLR